MGAADSSDANLQQLLSKLKLKGWLDEQMGKALQTLRKMIGNNYTVALPNNESLDLIWIPAGTFLMGSPDGEIGRNKDTEGPQTKVLLTKGFWLGKYKVTQSQWESVTGVTQQQLADRDKQENPDSQWHKVRYIKPNLYPQNPVFFVTWNESMSFCQKLTDQERAAGRLPQGYEYTLPTEAEWEYACRAGTTGSTSGDINQMALYNLSGEAFKFHPVGQKQANSWGLFDMYGNVEEWCRNWYLEYPGGNLINPLGPASGQYRIVRSSGIGSTSDAVRSASRRWAGPAQRLFGVGFRLALTPFLQ